MLVRKLTRLAGSSPEEKLPAPMRKVSGIDVADTPLVTRAMEIASTHMPPYLFNHVMRSWLFAAVIADERGQPHDAEVLAVSSLLHDIGLVEEFSGPLRFEVEGANFAHELAVGFDVDERRAQLIWDSIALNSTPSICLHKEPEASLCALGVGLDWGGWGYETVPAAVRGRVLADYPRLDMKRGFARDVCAICESRPETTYDNFARDFGARFVPGYQQKSMVDVLFDAPFDE